MSEYIRLNIITEGATEKRFVKEVLVKHLFPFGIFCISRSVKTSKGNRGGIPNYVKAKNDIREWLNRENSKDV